MTDLLSYLTEQSIKVLTNIYESKLKKQPSDLEPTSSGKKERSTLEAKGKEIAEDLLRQALASGFRPEVAEFTDKSLSGGNTAEFVGEIVLKLPFVLKMDGNTKKLADEAIAIRTIKNNPNLPKAYRDCWPEIYAIRTESPYAYLMEYFHPSQGWNSLENILYPKNFNSVQKSLAIEDVSLAIEKLNLGFSGSINRRQLPNITEDYISRIKERLEKTAQQDSRFSSLSTIINGRQFKPWREYLAIIKTRSAKINSLTPPFSTVVHGDPNPGNILLKTDGKSHQIRFIDPKEWIYGDYLFDICKFAHFISATGPVEKRKDPIMDMLFESGGAAVIINYKLDKPDWTDDIVELFTKFAGKFATENGDVHWKIRYELGMAANLLGLPLGRLKKERIDAAAVLYAEGIIWLDKFCNHLGYDSI